MTYGRRFLVWSYIMHITHAHAHTQRGEGTRLNYQQVVLTEA
jgi:hypothetical protein